jgi:Flp pilus assembly protein TadD
VRLAPIAAIVCSVATAHAAVEDDLRDGDKFFDGGEWKRAAAAYDRAIAKAPSQVPAEAYGKRAAIFIILEDFKGGLDFVTKAKLRHPSAPEILEQEALLLWQTERRDEAVAVAEKVVAARPSAFTNQKLLGEYYALRDPAKTASAFEHYLAHRPSELEGSDVMPRVRLGFAYLALARNALGENDASAQQLYMKAAEQFEHLLKKLAKKPNAVVNAENGLCAAYTGLARWDQAINICERVSRDSKHIDAAGSVWFNLSKAYLARKQTKKARSAATEFARIRKNEARALMLLGDTYFADRDWQGALDHYLRAEKSLRPTQVQEGVELSIQLGKTYRRLPGGTKNLELAIDKLAAAFSSHPTSIELAVELGGAYLEARQDTKALELTDKLTASAPLANAPPEQRAAVLVLAGKALFNGRKLGEARQRFEAARELRTTDVQIQRALVTTINEQAFEAKDSKAAGALLDQALVIDPSSASTLTNIAVLSIERGDCEAAQRQLARLGSVRGTDAVVTARLVARTYLCGPKPDRKKANDAYAAAEREAKKANAQVGLAEIYTEWAPLLWDSDLAGAIQKLELANAQSATSPELAQTAKRNLALALYRRGWKLVRDGKAADATSDFERALRDPSALRGSEPLAVELSLALATLDAGRAADAAKLFRGLVSKGSGSTYLQGGYAKVGPAFFGAYANARSQAGTARQQACNELARLEPDLGGRARELVASCWEGVAFDQWRAGNVGAAKTSLATAQRYASTEQKKRLDVDRAALSLDKSKLEELEAIGATPAEALVNLGIVYDLLGRPKDAYDTWLRAKSRGASARDLQKWLDAKKRIYGY